MISQERLPIGTDSKRESKEFVLLARLDGAATAADDDDDGIGLRQYNTTGSACMQTRRSEYKGQFRTFYNISIICPALHCLAHKPLVAYGTYCFLEATHLKN